MADLLDRSCASGTIVAVQKALRNRGRASQVVQTCAIRARILLTMTGPVNQLDVSGCIGLGATRTPEDRSKALGYIDFLGRAASVWEMLWSWN
jgi:hypothetical protein